ncbi:MAG TPA: DNA polymerase III subunit alpha, partial [Chitinophagales bacterium]|nr:DNA polymerase III subunit alpha [Chitinophagales bacterium]
MFLNCHTCFSFKFGMIKPEDLLREAADKGVRKLVVSDINNTSAILDIHRLARKYNVKPVAGIDFRNEAQQKFIGIAKNEEGFRELNEFLSYHLKEEETFQDRAPEFHHAFIIYPFSNAPHHLNENEYIGIRPGELNRLIFSGIKHLHNKLVILQPVTFRERETREIGDKDRKRKITYELRHLHNGHRLLRAMHNNVVLSKLPQHDQAMPDEIMVQPDQLMRLYKDFPHLIYNTEKLLDACEVIDFKFAEDDDGTEARSSNKNRKYFLTNPSEDYELMMRLCEDGMYRRYPQEDSAIRERFTKEIKIIVEKQFSSYFLINHDIVQYARHKDFFYVGRGSGANSMVAYLLNITDVDPIELDLYFERFINPSRKNPPDFDIDFSWAERDQIIQYIFDKYGDQHTALLGTYSEMKTDSLLRELGKVFGLPKREIDALQNYQENQTADHITRGIWQYAQLLYSFPNHLSIHAGGILISQRPVNYYTALSHPPKGHGLTQFSMQEAEDVGFAKFDILSQRGLGKVRDAVNLIKENKGEDIDIHDVKRCINDEDVRKNLQEAKLMGCFYVESPAMRMLLTKLKASTYLDLVAASSIIRPGVAQSGMMQEYIRRFHETDHGKSRAIPELWDIMEETFGVMVYQEDVIKVAYKFGGFTLEEADKLRRGMGGKYRGRQEFLDVKEKFFANCRRDGKDEKVVNEIWFQMETFGGYAFAKGHSASYAVESYQCMFLKTHYPLEFMVAVINNGGGFFGVEYYIHEASMCGGIIHAPHINLGEISTTISGKNIYLGFNLIKELEQKLQEEIMVERNCNGAFSSLENFMKRVSISVDQLRILIRIGAFHFTGRTKKQLLWDVHAILGHQKKSIARKELFEVENKKYSLPELDTDTFEDARNEMEILEFPLCSPFSLVYQPLPSSLVAADLKKYVNKQVEIVGYYVTRKPTSTKKGEAMMFGCFLDKEG